MQKPHDLTGSRPRVLVLGREIRAFLSVIRSLGRANLEVHVGMCADDDIALKSNYVSAFHAIPEHKPESTAWLDRISELIRTYEYALVVPTHDESAIPMQIHKDELAEIGCIYNLSEDAFDIAFDKIKSSELAASLGVKLPKQATIDIAELNDGPPVDFNFPIVIKPSSSYTQDDLAQRREVTVVSSTPQLMDTVSKNSGWGEVLIQEVFHGVGTGVEVLANNGEILAIFQHERVHEPLGGGASSYRKSVSLNPELKLATEKLIAALKYTGVAMVEYKIDLDTGDWIFIEINGRFWGSLPLALASGVDFPFYLYDLLVNANTEQRPAGKENVFCRNLRRDVYWNIDNLKERRTDEPSPDSIPLSIVLQETLRLITFRDHIDSFTIDDPKPGFIEFREIGAMVVAKGHSFARRRIRNSRPMRYRNSNKIRDIVHSSEQILFVCSGNICRSPFAEHYAKSALPGVFSVKSSGFHPQDNRCSPFQAIGAALRFEIDLRTHRSSTISEMMVEDSNIIFVFEEKNYERFCVEFPDSTEKVFFLGDLKPQGDYEIEDPYGGDEKRFIDIYNQIRSSIDALRLK